MSWPADGGGVGGPGGIGAAGGRVGGVGGPGGSKGGIGGGDMKHEAQPRQLRNIHLEVHDLVCSPHQNRHGYGGDEGVAGGGACSAGITGAGGEGRGAAGDSVGASDEGERGALSSCNADEGGACVGKFALDAGATIIDPEDASNADRRWESTPATRSTTIRNIGNQKQ